MRFGFYNDFRPCLVEDDGVIDISDLIGAFPGAPLPRPGKVLCGRRNFKEGVPLDPPGPLRTFFKSPDAVIGPGETVVLPTFRASVFNHEAELALVIGKEAKDVPVEQALNHVFGYTTSGDVSARAPVE